MMRTTSVAFLASVVVSVSAVAGDLNPPAGAVAPTMKTLQQVEPRIPISATTTPGNASAVFVITQPGSYYLTGNISVPSNFSGIEVSAAGPVTIDFRGFSIIGQLGSIFGVTSAQTCTIYGGGIFATDGGIAGSLSLIVDNMTIELANLSGRPGISTAGATDSRVTNTTVRGAGDYAIEIAAGIVSNCTISCPPSGDGVNVTRGVIERCTIVGAGTGINVSNAVVRDCSIISSTSVGILSFAATTIERCIVVQDAGLGVSLLQAGEVSDTTVFGSGTAFQTQNDSTIRGSNAIGFTFRGFNIGADCTLERCTATGAGIAVFTTAGGATLRDCVVTDAPISLGNSAHLTNVVVRSTNGTGITVAENSVLVGCRSSVNAGSGFSIGPRSIVTDCLAASNTQSGFVATDSVTFTNCRAESNTLRGFIGNDRCTFTACAASLNSSSGFVARDGATFTNCYASDNTGDGFNARFGSRWDACTSRSNTADGIEASSGAIVLNCLLDTNGLGATVGANIRITGDSGRIDGNSLIGADFGIQTTGGGNLIVRNHARNNTSNYGGIAPGNDVGPIGAAATATSPWANIQ